MLIAGSNWAIGLIGCHFFIGLFAGLMTGRKMAKLHQSAQRITRIGLSSTVLFSLKSM